MARPTTTRPGAHHSLWIAACVGSTLPRLLTMEAEIPTRSGVRLRDRG